MESRSFSPKQNRAIVLGASVAGLCAARVLSDWFTEVWVVDRDPEPISPLARKGVPQGKHVHGFLSRGVEALDQLFPGLVEQLYEQGAVSGDVQRDAVWCVQGKPLVQQASGMRVVAASRPFIDYHLRKRVATIPNIRFISETVAQKLEADHSKQQITGVVVLNKQTNKEETFQADLIVDASGRGSRANSWLEELGYQSPQCDKFRIDVHYSSQTYRVPKSLLGTKKAWILSASAISKKGAVAHCIENDLFEVSLAGIGGERPPSDPEGFLAYASKLCIPDLYEILKGSEPLGEIVNYRNPFTQRNYYERLSRFPTGFLVIGDAICAFNPVYAQGMTVAACEAQYLQSILQRSPSAELLAKEFFTKITPLLDSVWQMSRASDMQLAEEQPSPSFPVRMVQHWLKLVQQAATQDGEIARRFLRIASLLEPKERLFSPTLAVRVLASLWRIPHATNKNLNPNSNPIPV
jgi:2-polyprenyl-6-methoxyphenol hydroxylase-like FAD-dependent oxidoreductase